jgi:MFS family permease
MRSTADPDGRDPARRVVTASFTATTLEWYGVFLYGTAAALVFNRLFFPASTPLRGTLLALSTNAVALIARPLGGLAFGRVGDRVGRRPALVSSLLVTGVATVLIGCLPTAHQVGVAAPALLVLLRFAQGFGLGGEWGGATLLAVEHAPPGRRGWSGSWPQAGVYAGLLLSTVVYVAAQALISDAQFLAWGWRVPFLAGAAVALMALYVQRRVPESPAFTRLMEDGTEAWTPVVDVLRRYPRQLLLAIGMRAGESGGLYVLTVFVLTYGPRQLGLPQVTMLAGIVLATLLGLLTVPLFGGLSDRLGRRPLSLTGATGLLLLAFPFFRLLETGSTPLIWLVIIVGVNLAHDLMYGPQAAWFAELFSTRLRCSGVSIATQVGSALGGGLAPLVTTWALATVGVGGVVLYLAVIALISFLSAWYAPETFRADIAADRPEERDLIEVPDTGVLP